MIILLKNIPKVPRVLLRNAFKIFGTSDRYGCFEYPFGRTEKGGTSFKSWTVHRS